MNAEKRNLVVSCWLAVLIGLTGCAGPLDTSTKQALKADFRSAVYQTKFYLGNQEYLEYTNNSIAGRSPTGLFIDRYLSPWYETDAAFWEGGTSGERRSLSALLLLDRDLDFDHYAQGIDAGQLVRIREFSDKRDRLIVTVETLGGYDAKKVYGRAGNGRVKPRSARMHFLLGKDGMKPFDRTAFVQMLGQILAKQEPLTSEDQRRAFIQRNYPQTPLADLIRFTGLSKRTILEIYYAAVLEDRALSPGLQSQFAANLADLSESWPQVLGVWLEKLESASGSLNFHCAVQEISDSLLYHSPELRAGLLFFNSVIPLLKDMKSLLESANAAQLFECITISFAYPFFDPSGRRHDEVLSFSLPSDALQQFLRTEIDEQGLADRSEILYGKSQIRVNLEAQKAVESVALKKSPSWKNVAVEVLDYDYEEDESGVYWILTGEVINRGNWIARDIEITVEGYGEFGFFERATKTIRIDGLLKPNQTREFTLRVGKKKVKRFKLDVEWSSVE
ncbi:hypothetical protein CSB45_08790 [candidate division KSB3 bacterium]|uniref:Uncharacterized protein n=1 Tax=candidate division KSB3 bacterium TaxID=2044937 RepID=A0A2G6E5G9_9BACT|nr:MAG: hypothetical protein CSB45_08790 [candidate division KSB3 bacterium]PIE29682.1 MAG: hypothetical protein CSA57_07645 [candidate division KSB3 bacterium]